MINFILAFLLVCVTTLVVVSLCRRRARRRATDRSLQRLLHEIGWAVSNDERRADKSVDPVVKHKDTETSPSDDSEIWW